MTLSLEFLDRRPLVIAIAGSNGAGKSTFFASHMADSGLRFVNADVLAAELAIGAYEAAEIATALRQALVGRGESFLFETVLSDPVGEKVDQLASYLPLGYEVALIVIHIPDPETSIERVSIRASQGGHDIPDEKLLAVLNEPKPTCSGRLSVFLMCSFMATPISTSPSDCSHITPAGNAMIQTVKVAMIGSAADRINSTSSSSMNW